MHSIQLIDLAIVAEMVQAAEILDNTTQLAQRAGILDIFRFQVERRSNCTAVTCGNRQLTYLELDQHSNQLARFLAQQGLVAPNQPVAIMGSNKLEMLICELAILKAGGVFVPFETDIPKERLAFTLKNAGAQLLIACDQESSAVASTAHSGKILCLPENQEALDQISFESFYSESATESDLAYILYTSGSTSATPKGVMQTRGGLLGQIENYTENLNITEQDHFLQLAPLTHDQAMVDIYGALLNGAAVHFVDMNLKTLNFQTLRDFIAQHQISIFSSIPSVFSLIFEDVENDTSFPHLRIVTLGGEAVKIDHVRLYQKVVQPHCLFINGYGATEFSWLSYFIIKKDTPLDQMHSIPLGHLASQTELFLDYTEGDLLLGIGELCVHCPFQSPGYWNNEEATNKAFFKKDGKVYYSTGDLVEMDGEGILHFKGRLSWHEKINGKRVNLKEVEDQMLSTFPFEECVVLAHGEENNKRLYAFYTVKKEELFLKDKKTMRSELRAHLKIHEIPFKFYALEAFPLLQNAKVNRQELKNFIDLKIQERAQKRSENSTYESRLDLVTKLYWEALDLEEEPDLFCNFWEFGPSSMDIMHFVNRLNRRFGFNLDIEKVYESGSLFDIYELVEDTLKGTNTKINFFERVEKPAYQEKPLFNYEHKPLQYVCEEHKMLQFNFAGMQLLAEHYSKKYGIYMRACASQSQFVDEFVTFMRKKEYGQIGLTWPQGDVRDGHPTACIFRIDENGLSIYITDSVGDYPMGLCKLLSGCPLPITYHADPYAQQKDKGSCMVWTILYLKDALRLDMSKVIKKISIEEIIKKDPDVLEIYPDGFIFFQNPPELLKHAQSQDFPSGLFSEVDLNAPLKLSKRKRSLSQYFKDHRTETTYTSESAPNLKITQNTSLYKKAKFKHIIDKGS
jgi:amino acid adenylation domain-containing protein